MVLILVIHPSVYIVRLLTPSMATILSISDNFDRDMRLCLHYTRFLCKTRRSAYMLWKGLRFIHVYLLCIHVCNVYLVMFGHTDGIGLANWMVQWLSSPHT